MAVKQYVSPPPGPIIANFLFSASTLIKLVQEPLIAAIYNIRSRIRSEGGYRLAIELHHNPRRSL